MAGTLNINTLQLGDSGTAAYNFKLEVPSTENGTCTLKLGDGTPIVSFAGDIATWGGPSRALVSSVAGLTVDMSLSNDFIVTPSATGTLTFTNIGAGQSGNIIFVNNANYSIAKASSVKANSSFLSVISATGSYWISYNSPDGTNVYVTTTQALS